MKRYELGGALGIGYWRMRRQLHTFQWRFDADHLQAEGLMDPSRGQALAPPRVRFAAFPAL